MLEETWPKEKRIQPHENKFEILPKIRDNKSALSILTLWGFHTISFTIVMTSLSFFSVSVLDLTPIDISILFMTSGIFRTGIRFTLFKPTIRKLGEDNAIRLGLATFLVCFFFLGFSTNIFVLFILMMFISFAASLTRGPMLSKITQTASPQEQGKINGLSSALDSMAQILGPLIGPFILDTLPPYWLGITVAIIAFPPFVMAFQKIFAHKN